MLGLILITCPRLPASNEGAAGRSGRRTINVAPSLGCAAIPHRAARICWEAAIPSWQPQPPSGREAELGTGLAARSQPGGVLCLPLTAD